MAGKQTTKQNTEKKTRPAHNLGKITKTYNVDGRWTEKKHKTEILICACGNRYIKTRSKQTVCLRCLAIELR